MKQGESIRAYFITPGSAPRLCATYPARPKRRCPAHHRNVCQAFGNRAGQERKEGGFSPGSPPCQSGEHCHQHTHTHGSRRGSQPGLPLAPSLVLGQAVSEGQQEPGWGTRPCPGGTQENRHSPRRNRHTEQHVHAGRGAKR